MTSSIFAALFGLNFVLFPCKGQISLPPGGDTFVVLPGRNVTIAWKLDVRVSDLKVRSWTFLPKQNDTFAKILRDGDVLIQTQYSPGPFAITKPSTLILKNVTIQYNGTYRFFVYTKGESTESFVHVSVTAEPNSPQPSYTISHNGKQISTEKMLTMSDTISHNGKQISTEQMLTISDTISHNGKQVSSGKTFAISEVKRSDERPYTCVTATVNLTSVGMPQTLIGARNMTRGEVEPNVTLSCSSPITLYEGDDFTCVCRGEGGNPSANVTWYKDGVQIGGTGMEEQALTLSNVNGTDNGTYKCMAQSHINAMEEKSIEIKLVITPTVTLSCSSPITVNEGDDFTCVCRGEGGNPPANVAWYKDGVQIGGTGMEEQALTLSNVNGTDNGTYNATDEKSIEIKLGKKPTVTLSCFSPITVNEGDDFTCVCRGEGGNPLANVTWYKDGEQIGGTGKEEQTLTLSNIDAGTDSGNYKCEARRSSLTNAKSIEVKVRLNSCKKVNCESSGTWNWSGTVVVWHIVASSVSGIILGILVSCIVWCSCRCCFRNRRHQTKSEPMTTEAGRPTTYQELDLLSMNAQDNYQSLGVNAASNNAAYDVEQNQR